MIDFDSLKERNWRHEDEIDFDDDMHGSHPVCHPPVGSGCYCEGGRSI